MAVSLTPPVVIIYSLFDLQNIQSGGDAGLAQVAMFWMACALAFVTVLVLGIPACIWSHRLARKQGIDSRLAKFLRAGVMVVMAGFLVVLGLVVFLLLRAAKH